MNLDELYSTIEDVSFKGRGRMSILVINSDDGSHPTLAVIIFALLIKLANRRDK